MAVRRRRLRLTRIDANDFFYEPNFPSQPFLLVATSVMPNARVVQQMHEVSFIVVGFDRIQFFLPMKVKFLRRDAGLVQSFANLESLWAIPPVQDALRNIELFLQIIKVSVSIKSA